uniref:Otopetrin-2 n=2 Tax=Lygus hesperus TaxID=30085 RepID=A0A146MDH9_LYGHE
MHRVNELNESLPSSHRGSLVSTDLATINEKEPMTPTDENEEVAADMPPLTNLKKNKFFGSNSSIAMMVKGSKRGRSLSMPFIHKGPPDLHRAESDKIFLETLTITLSGLYCKLLIVLGMSFPVAEFLSQESPTTFYKGFYLYLYIVSMLFLAFVYSTLLKQKAVDTVLNTAAATADAQAHGDRPKRRSIHQHSTGRYGSFYLRMGAVAFGIGSMIFSGLEFGHYLEMAHKQGCRDYLMAVTPTIRMAFIIIQLQFIFVSNKQKMLKEYQTISRFGLMHMIATNICVWLSVVATETGDEIISFYNDSKNAADIHNHTGMTAVGGFIQVNRTALMNHRSQMEECRRTVIMGALLKSAAPFLSPCTIEYSLISSVILYALWKNVCTHQTNVIHTGAYANKVPKPVTGMTSQHFTVDCANAHKGLFASILVLVFTIISLIMFNVLVKKEHSAPAAIFQVNVCELTLYTMGTLACLLAMHKIKRLRYEKNRQFELDTLLLIMAQSGLYIYFMFSAIAAYLTLDDHSSRSPGTVLLMSTCGILQSTLQTLFIVDAWWRRCTTSQNSKEKPARQLVTFLLLTNVAMWSVNHMESARAEFQPIELGFYGIWAWSIITQISMPLAVFYRFHSTVCLCEIWKCTYKMKLQPVA